MAGKAGRSPPKHAELRKALAFSPFSVPGCLLSSSNLHKPTERERLVHSKLVTTMLQGHTARFYSRLIELQCFQMHCKTASPDSKLRTHKLSLALQTDPHTWKGGFALRIHRSTRIFRLALNLPNSKLLAPSPSHCWVQLGSWTRTSWSSSMHPGSESSLEIHSSHLSWPRSEIRHPDASLQGLCWFGLSPGLSATPLANAGIILFHFF